MKKTNESCKLEIGATSSKGNSPHPYTKNDFKGSKEVQKHRKEIGMVMSWEEQDRKIKRKKL